MSRISLIHQEGSLRSYFPGSRITRRGEEEITWVHTLTPSPLSTTYEVKLHYCEEKGISIYVLNPVLRLAPGETTLPHVYSTPKQKLCLYYPKNREWHAGMFYVQTIIPWTSEWLLHYEIWAGGGGWHGGGIDHKETIEG